MGNPKIMINGEVYPLATTLRVAYKVQGQNNHKPYTEVFQGIAEMPVEKQVGIIYASLTSNKGSIPMMTEQEFCEYCLDNMNIKELMGLLQEIIKGIMGTEDDESAPDTQEESEKN